MNNGDEIKMIQNAFFNFFLVLKIKKFLKKLTEFGCLSEFGRNFIQILQRRFRQLTSSLYIQTQQYLKISRRKRTQFIIIQRSINNKGIHLTGTMMYSNMR